MCFLVRYIEILVRKMLIYDRYMYISDKNTHLLVINTRTFVNETPILGNCAIVFIENMYVLDCAAAILSEIFS